MKFTICLYQCLVHDEKFEPKVGNATKGLLHVFKSEIELYVWNFIMEEGLKNAMAYIATPYFLMHQPLNY